MLSRRVLSWLASCLIAGVAAPAAADARAPAPRAIARPAAAAPVPAPRPQHMRFDDDLVEGARALGGGTLITGQKAARRSQLLITRTSFVPELIKSAEQL